MKREHLNSGITWIISVLNFMVCDNRHRVQDTGPASYALLLKCATCVVSTVGWQLHVSVVQYNELSAC